MSYFFTTQGSLLTQKAKKSFDKLQVARDLNSFFKKSKKISTAGEYQNNLVDIVGILKKNKMAPAQISIHTQEITPIKNGKPLTEKVVWGGVALKKVDVAKDFIQKLLVINKFGILGFEIHKQKLEKLKVLEGFCLVFYSNHKARNWQKGQIVAKLAAPGDKFEFQPNDEHGVIALTDCVVEETSTNHLDDLYYIFKASQVNT
jgi:hypothetical protein